jgi:phage FluMu protein Com
MNNGVCAVMYDGVVRAAGRAAFALVMLNIRVACPGCRSINVVKIRGEENTQAKPGVQGLRPNSVRILNVFLLTGKAKAWKSLGSYASTAFA